MSRVDFDEPIRRVDDSTLDTERNLRQLVGGRAENSEKNPYFRGTVPEEFYEKVWNKSSLFIAIGVIAAIVWLLGAIVKLAVPGKWHVVAWIVGALTWLGKWVFIACLVLAVLALIIGFVLRITRE